MRPVVLILVFYFVWLNMVNCQSKIYWIDSYLDQIKRANLDGSDVELIVSLGNAYPQGIDIDQEHGKIYWIDSDLDEIRRANLDGSDIELIDTLGNADPQGIDIDQEHGKIYWVDSYLDEVKRANLDGSEVESIVSLGNAFPQDIAVDPLHNKVYWIDTFLDQISRANLDGSNVEVIVNAGGVSIAIDKERGKIYWIGSAILRANLDGSDIETIVNNGLFNPQGIDVDESQRKIYWIDSYLNEIKRANLDGSSTETIVNLGNAYPQALAIDEVKPYFPLEIGNRWDFAEGWWDGSGNSSEDTVVYRVISDTVLQNGKTYFKILPESVLFKNLIRSDSIGIYYYDIECDTEWLFYSFDIPVGEPIKVPMYICDTTDSPVVYKTSEDSIIYFGNNVNFLTFHYDGGIDNWFEITLTHEFGFTNWISSDLLKNYYKSLVGCELGGMVYGTLTSIEREPTKLSVYSLKQNYPNPFNSITNIDFDIPDRQIASLKVYDILGNQIAVLVDGEVDAGKHRLKFNAADLCSGVYIYQLRTKFNIISRKMSLIK